MRGRISVEQDSEMKTLKPRARVAPSALKVPRVQWKEVDGCESDFAEADGGRGFPAPDPISQFNGGEGFSEFIKCCVRSRDLRLVPDGFRSRGQSSEDLVCELFEKRLTLDPRQRQSRRIHEDEVTLVGTEGVDQKAMTARSSPKELERIARGVECVVSEPTGRNSPMERPDMLGSKDRVEGEGRCCGRRMDRLDEAEVVAQDSPSGLMLKEPRATDLPVASRPRSAGTLGRC